MSRSKIMIYAAAMLAAVSLIITNSGQYYTGSAVTPRQIALADSLARLNTLSVPKKGITRNENEAWKWLQYGVRTAFPNLVAEAKKPLSEQDRRAFESRFSQNSVTSFSPFSYKMYLLIGDEGIIRIGGVEMNLVNKGLRAYFTPYHWRKTSYNIDKL